MPRLRQHRVHRKSNTEETSLLATPILLHDLILGHAAQFGDRPALIGRDETLSYENLASRVSAVAAGLVDSGLRAGERVAVYLNKRPEMIAGCFGTSAAGGVFVPVNPVLKKAQVRHILDDCTATILITSAAFYNNLGQELAGCASLRTVVLVDVDDTQQQKQSPRMLSWTRLVEAHGRKQDFRQRIDNDVASILYTSGSTGKPKGVVLSHRNMVAGAASVAGYIGNNAEDRILAALPFSFDAGFSQLTTGFLAGAAVILFDYLLPLDVLKVAARHGATGLTAVPPLWNQLVKLEWPGEVRQSLRYIANTGGAMPTATLKKLRAQLPDTKVFLMYGLTESFRSTYLAPDQVDKRPTSIGKAIPNAQILVVRDDGSHCAPGEPGELVHRGALVSLGYWNDPERTARRFKPLPGKASELPFEEMTVWSGDTVYADDEGYLYFVGRKDDMIKSSGYRISPSEVEEAVFGSGCVSECAAIGVPHPDIGQAIVVIACGTNPGEQASAEILVACRAALPNFMVPAQIVWRDKLPKNPNGKIDRKLLAEELADSGDESRE
ncbi:MAG TPA: acyl-CoA ligase (AMP-forming), exosortase A system-associated [Woeseiaceae bacterium]|nr:acyl-CoA ligase (AMP-forming), exosortase A system-associated [Woeseiaceae bacterium]